MSNSKMEYLDTTLSISLPYTLPLSLFLLSLPLLFKQTHFAQSRRPLRS